MTSAPAKGLISSRTRACTGISAAVSARSSHWGVGWGEFHTGLILRASPHQPTMARMESLATYMQPAPTLPEQSPDTPGSSQSPITELRPPLTAPFLIGGSRTSVIKGSPLPGEVPSQTPGLAQLLQPRQPPWPTMPSIAQLTVFVSYQLQPPSRGQPQLSIQLPPVISVPVLTPPTTT